MFPFGPRLSGKHPILPSFTFFCIVWGQRDIPQSFLISSATVLADISSPFPFSHTYTNTAVAHLKAVKYLFFFSNAATWCSYIAVAVERGTLAFFTGAQHVTRMLSADIVTEEIGSLFDLLTVIDCCAGGVAKSSFFVLFSRQTTIIYFDLSSCSWEKNRPVSSHHKLWGSDSWADTQRPFGSKNLLAHCSYACWLCLVSIACEIPCGLARYIVSNIICLTKMLKMLHRLL